MQPNVAVGEEAVGPQVKAVRIVCECIRLASLEMAWRGGVEEVDKVRELSGRSSRRSFLEVWISSVEAMYEDLREFLMESGTSWHVLSGISFGWNVCLRGDIGTVNVEEASIKMGKVKPIFAPAPHVSHWFAMTKI